MALSKILILLAALLGAACSSSTNIANWVSQPTVNAKSSIDTAYEKHASHVIVEGHGDVVKIFADDNLGSHHQKFLVKIASGKTLLFTHNIDLAPRVDDLRIGDTLDFKGEYVFNPKGGVIHWTHRDPSGEHVAGWIKHNGKTYE
jgi:hypothetical protein